MFRVIYCIVVTIVVLFFREVTGKVAICWCKWRFTRTKVKNINRELIKDNNKKKRVIFGVESLKRGFRVESQPNEFARISLANVIVLDMFLNWNQKVLSAFSLTDW